MLERLVTVANDLSAKMTSARTLWLSISSARQHCFPLEAEAKVSCLTLQTEFLGIWIFRMRPRHAACFYGGQLDL